MSNKTVVDAVNELKGDFYNAKNGGEDGPYLMQVITDEYCDNVNIGGFVRYTCDEERLGRDDVAFVCLEAEFNQCVAEMSEGLFVPDCRPKMPEIQYDDDGNGLEVGAIYEFSDGLGDWFLDKLLGVNCSESLSYRSACSCWGMIRECQSPIGKIHKKPVELVDGAAYQFSAYDKIMVGFYHGESKKFKINPAPLCELSLCELEYATNIIRLVPEVK